MKKKKYPISREFFPYDRFTPPVSMGFVRMAQKWMKVPSYFLHDKEGKIYTARTVAEHQANEAYIAGK